MIEQYCLDILKTFLTYDDFKKMNIDKTKIYAIETEIKKLNNLSEIKEEMILYVIQPNKEILEDVIDSFYNVSNKFKGVLTNIIFIPGERYELIEFMMANDLIHNFKIFDFNIDLLPIDNDLLSLEKDNSFKEIYIDKNLTSISELANAFIKLESCYGKVKYRYYKGDNSKVFDNLVKEKEKENDIKSTEETLGMIVLDRSVDFLTALTTNYTYEGLIDDFFNINYGSIKIKESFIKDSSNPKKNKINNEEKMVKYSLTSFFNPFYCQIRCMNFEQVEDFLKKIKEHYQNIANSEDDKDNKFIEIGRYNTEIKWPLEVNETLLSHIKNNIGDSQYRQHIENEQLLLSGEIPENLHLYYDNYICDKKDLIKILKLLSIECITQGGISNYNSIKRDILNIYGYQNIFLFRDLENLGFLIDNNSYKKKDTLNFSKILDDLKLINLDYQKDKFEDCSYLMLGYCPISLKLIEKGIEGKWNKIQDIIKKLPGETGFPPDESEMMRPTKELNTIFLVFIGGVTYTEIEGIRYLNRKFKEQYENNKDKNPTRIQLIIVTTCILNTKKLFKNLGKNFNNIYSMKQFYEQNQKKKK